MWRLPPWPACHLSAPPTWARSSDLRSPDHSVSLRGLRSGPVGIKVRKLRCAHVFIPRSRRREPVDPRAAHLLQQSTNLLTFRRLQFPSRHRQPPSRLQGLRHWQQTSIGAGPVDWVWCEGDPEVPSYLRNVSAYSRNQPCSHIGRGLLQDVLVAFRRVFQHCSCQDTI